MKDVIKPPFEPEDRLVFTLHQKINTTHTYTCPNEGTELEIKKEHIYCPYCDYRQYWMHNGIFTNPDPK